MKTIITADINQAAAILRSGQTVIFPTETVYGLGADATNPYAVAAIFAAKQRPADNPLIVHIWDAGQVDELAHSIPAYARDLMAAFFPGPFTILLPKKPVVPDITTAGTASVCLRMPSLALARDLIKEAGRPIAAPSANLSGRPSPTRWQDCLEDMDGRVACILAGPDAQFGLESTIVDATGAVPVLMRPGAVTFEQLAQIVPTILPAPAANAPVTPGTKYRHYAPRARVELLDAGEVPALTGDQTAYIGITSPAFATGQVYVAPTPEDYAHSLFAFFRDCDRQKIVRIYAERVESVGIGRALMNRLQKAAAG
jgi:L-threonylcarbamoyladenylate synthase